MSKKSAKGRLKSVVIIPKTTLKPKVSAEKTESNYNSKRSRLGDKSSNGKSWPSLDSLARHRGLRPLGRTDDWGPLTHRHELMPMDNVRYWHQHRCDRCDHLFEHKHKQRGQQSESFNKHICNHCGGTTGNRRVA